MVSTVQRPSTSSDRVEVEGARSGVRARIRDRLDTVKSAYNTTDGVRGVIKSLVWRNRRQLLPFTVAVPVAVIGGGSAAAALHTHRLSIVILTALGATLLVAVVGTIVAHRFAEQITQVGMAERVTMGLVLAPLWCLLVPVIGPTRPLTWFLLLAGTVVLSLRWWQRIRPGYVFTRATPDEAAPVQEAVDIDSPIRQIMDRWERFVQRPSQAMPGATLNDPLPTSQGVDYQVQLVQGKQTLGSLRNSVDKIASAIGHFSSAISFGEGPTPSQAVMHVRLQRVFEPVYEGPRILQEGGDTWIGVGPHVDGKSVERYHLFSPDSVHGGFILGSKGSGKSRLLESLATGFRKLGVEIWWLDPQNGNSSPALTEHADWSLSGLAAQVDGKDDPYGNIRKLLAAMHRVATTRSMEHAEQKVPGFTHVRERPAIMVMIDECHMVFNTVDPKTNRTFGEAFGNLDRIFRKTGMGLLAASQIYTLDTFGNSPALRSGLIAGNVLVLRMMEKAHAALLPGDVMRPDQIPSGGGWGFSCGDDAARRGIMWRAEYNADPDHWLCAYPRATLDPMAVKMAGESYLLREEETEQSRAQLRTTLTRMRIAGPEEAQRLLREFQGHSTKDQQNAAAVAFGDIPLGPTWRPPDPDPVTASGLTERQEDVLLAFDGEETSVEELAERMEITQQMVRRHLASLGETHLVKVRTGVYRPRIPGPGLSLPQERDCETGTETLGETAIETDSR